MTTCRPSRPTTCRIAYGNFQRGYLIVNRTGTTLIRDNVTAKARPNLTSVAVSVAESHNSGDQADEVRRILKSKGHYTCMIFTIHPARCGNPRLPLALPAPAKPAKLSTARVFRGVEFVCAYGSITATNGFTVTIKGRRRDRHADQRCGCRTCFDGTSRRRRCCGCRTSGTSKNVVKRVGYRGNKRYVKQTSKAPSRPAR